jgi:hypothetical protein
VNIEVFATRLIGTFGSRSLLRLQIPHLFFNRKHLIEDAGNSRPDGQLSGSDDLSATVAADWVFPAAVAELGR